MAGALPIVSEAEPYRPWFGRVPVAASPDDFVELVQWAYEHRAEVREQAATARAYVLSERTIEESVGRWREACGPASARQSRAGARQSPAVSGGLVR